MYNLTINRDALKKIITTNSDAKDAYKRIIRESLNNLMDNSFVYYRGTKKIESKIFTTVEKIFEDNETNIRIQINPELKEHFANFSKGNYTQAVMLYILKLKPKSLPLYLQIKKKDGYSNKNKRAGSPIYLSKEELIKLYSTEYKSFSKFKTNILTPSIEDINKKSDVTITMKIMSAKEKRKRSKYMLEKNVEVIFTIVNKYSISAKQKLLHAKNSIIGKFLKIDEGKFQIIGYDLDPVSTESVVVTLKTNTNIEFIRVKTIYEVIRQFSKEAEKAEDEIMKHMKVPGYKEMILDNL